MQRQTSKCVFKQIGFVAVAFNSYEIYKSWVFILRLNYFPITMFLQTELQIFRLPYIKVTVVLFEHVYINHLTLKGLEMRCGLTRDT